jgi:hypothetical protein
LRAGLLERLARINHLGLLEAIGDGNGNGLSILSWESPTRARPCKDYRTQ